MRVQIEVPPGELFDRITILEIKIEKITDEEKLTSVKTDLNQLMHSFGKLRNWVEGNRQQMTWPQLWSLVQKLRDLNARIWTIEDTIRGLEKAGDFGPRFIEIARLVYLTNDQRASVKKQINDLLGSDISEQKSYTEYTQKHETPHVDGLDL